MGNGYAAGTPRFTKKVKAVVINKKQDSTDEMWNFANDYVNGLLKADDEATDDDTDESDDADDTVDNANAEDDTIDNANATVDNADAETSASEEE